MTNVSLWSYMRDEAVDAAFYGMYESNPFAFALQRYARMYQDEYAFIWLDGKGKEEEKLTFRQLELNVRKYAYYLSHTLGIKAGERVIL